MFTEKQQEEYLKNYLNKCPYCGELNLHAENPTFAPGGTVDAKNTCNSCKKVWFENYSFSSISEEEING